MCFLFFPIFWDFGLNKNVPWHWLWMMVSFASVTGCWMDEPRPNLTVIENDIYEFDYFFNILIDLVHFFFSAQLLLDDFDRFKSYF